VTRFLRRLLGPPVLLVPAVLLQVTFINRLPLPGNAQPDMVLLIVLALAVVGGPVPGMLAGFVGGLGLDIAPPGSDLVGEKALVFCLVGYGCGLCGLWQRKGEENLPSLAALPIVPVCAAIAEVLIAGLGRMVSDPSMTVPAINHVLPAAILYDFFLSPVAVALVYGVRGGPKPAHTPFPPRKKGQAPGLAAVRAANGARLMPGSVPRLSFAGARPDPLRSPSPSAPIFRTSAPPLTPTFSGQGTGVSGLRGAGGSGLRGDALRGAGGSALRAATGPRGSRWLRDGGAGGTSRASGADRRGGLRPDAGPAGGDWLRSRSGPSSVRAGRRDGVIGGSVIGSGVTGGGFRSYGNGGFSGALGPSLFAGTGSRGPGRGWRRRGGLRVARHSAPRASAGWAPGGTGGWARSGRGPGKGWLKAGGPATAGLGLAADWSRRKKSSPGKGWLKPAKPVAYAPRRSPGRGWLSRKPPRIMFQRKPNGLGDKRIGGRR
jgi:rod shape-determining protein MreD